MKYAIFTLRGKTEQWLIGKKRKGEITKQDISDTINESSNTLEVWACDIENFKLLEDKEEIKEVFKAVQKENKLFI